MCSLLEHYKQLARQANARGNQMKVATIIGKHLSELFGDDHAAAHRFYRELEQTAPVPYYNVMRRK
jgi:hypothetical protein